MSSTAFFFPDDLIPHLSELKFRIPFGGPVEIVQISDGFVVSRGSFGLMLIEDKPGFPRIDGIAREGAPVLTIEQALDLAARAVRHMCTPPAIEEIQEFVVGFGNDKSELKADRKAMKDFCVDIVRLLKGEVGPEVPFAAYRAMDTFVREAVPSRFLLLLAKPKS